jgi:hypothetical protein
MPVICSIFKSRLYACVRVLANSAVIDIIVFSVCCVSCKSLISYLEILLSTCVCFQYRAYWRLRLFLDSEKFIVTVYQRKSHVENSTESLAFYTFLSFQLVIVTCGFL